MVDFDAVDRETLQVMADSGRMVVDCHRVLAKTSDNIVGEVLRDQGTFFEFDHYPKGDVFDPDSNAQFYYHAHRVDEHGHFHTFLREAGMDDSMRPIEQSNAEYMHERDETLSHIIAISMDSRGLPIGLFTTNRWVTADHWYEAADVKVMLDRFEIDLARPSWPVNTWITAMLRLFRPQILDLVDARDRAVAEWHTRHPGIDAFEDRDLGITSQCEISIDDQIAAVEAALASSKNHSPCAQEYRSHALPHVADRPADPHVHRLRPA